MNCIRPWLVRNFLFLIKLTIEDFIEWLVDLDLSKLSDSKLINSSQHPKSDLIKKHFISYRYHRHHDKKKETLAQKS